MVRRVQRQPKMERTRHPPLRLNSASEWNQSKLEKNSLQPARYKLSFFMYFSLGYKKSTSSFIFCKRYSFSSSSSISSSEPSEDPSSFADFSLDFSETL